MYLLQTCRTGLKVSLRTHYVLFILNCRLLYELNMYFLYGIAGYFTAKFIHRLNDIKFLYQILPDRTKNHHLKLTVVNCCKVRRY